MRRRTTLTLLCVGALASAVGGVTYWRSRMDGADRARRLEADFRSLLRGGEVTSLTPADGLEAMIQFLAKVKYPHDSSTPYGDTLLFQYGVYDWGRGENFDFNVTRQVIFEHAEYADADDHIIQLGLTFRYDPGPFRSMQAMTKWANEVAPPGDLASFVRGSRAYALVSELSPREVALDASAQ